MVTARKTGSFLIICLLAISAFSAILPRNYTTKAQLSNGAKLTGNVLDGGKDVDSDARYEYLVVGVEINVSSAGYYGVQVGYLQDPNGYNRSSWDYSSTVSSYGYRGVGIHVVNFSFFGPKIFADKFNVSAIVQINLYGAYSDYLDRAQLSRVYNYAEFDCGAVLTSVTYDVGIDTDGDGLFNKVQVGVELNVTDGARYEVGISAYAGGFPGSYIYNQTIVFLNPGIQTVNVSLDGVKVFSSRGDLSLLESIDLYVYDEGYRSYSLQYVYNRPLSKTYNYKEFDPMAFFTGVVSNTAIDDDGNGLFDYMRISVEVNVTDPGHYVVNLQDLTDNVIPSNLTSVYESFEADLQTGLHWMNLTVYGPIIYSAHTDPLYIRDLRLWLTSGYESILLEDRQMIQLPTPYSYGQFDSHAFLTGKIHDRGVDTDKDGLFNYLEVGVEVNVTKSGKYGISVGGLAGSRYIYNGTQQLYINQTTDVTLDVGVHVVNFSISGSMLVYYNFNPLNVTDLNLIQYSPYYQLGHIQTVALSKGYSYTQFNGPFNDMRVQLTVYPNATVEVGGSSNHTRIYPTDEHDYEPSTNATFSLSTQGNVTTGSLNGTMKAPRYPWQQFPYNSTNASFASKYNNGMLNAWLNASTSMPAAGSTTYPTNSSDFSFLATYSNGMLDVGLTGLTTLPSVVSSMLPYNITDVTVLADYRNDRVSGNMTFHTVSGFPFGDIIAHFSGNKTEIQVTGHINVIYGDYFGTTVNETSLEGMLSNFNSTFPGRGSQSLYNGTRGIVECTRLNTIITPIHSPSEGAKVDYNATVNGNFTDLVGQIVASMFFGGQAPAQTQKIVNAAVDSAFSSVDHASLTLNYYHGSRIGTIHLTLSDSVRAVWNNALQLVPLKVPSENRAQVEAWLKIGNSTAFAIENAHVNASYSSAQQRFDLHAWLAANVSRLKSEILPILPDAVPANEKSLVESCTNTTYCKLASLNATANYVNRVGNFNVEWRLKGNFTAQVNRIKDCYREYMNLTSPWALNWQMRLLNNTGIDLSNFKADVRQGTDWETLTFDGLKVYPAFDGIDRVRFKLLRWLEMMSDAELPRQFERLKIVMKGGFDGTHTVLLYSPNSVPSPDSTSLDYKSMTWQNTTIDSLKFLLFKIAYQGVANYVSRTYYVPVFTNSTVSNFGFDAGAKSISFNVAGDVGQGFCNVTIPRELLYAAPSEWTISVNGTALAPGSFNVTENAEYVFIYLQYSHSSHLIQIQGTSVVTEYPPMLLPLALAVLSIVSATVAIRQRRRLSVLKTKFGSTLYAIVSGLRRAS
jgi:hypothetical protein